MRRAVVPVLGSLLAYGGLLGVSGCSLIPGSSSTLDDALETLPAQATSVSFLDFSAADEDETGGGTTLLDGTDLDADHVRWIASGTADEDEWVVIKTSDDLDLDRLGDDLVDAGYTEDEIGGQRTFTRGQSSLATVPDEHLVVLSADFRTVLDVVHDDADSLVDSGDFAAVVEAADDPLDVLLQRDVECRGDDSLGHPEAIGFFVSADEETRTVLELADDDAAEADLAARETWLEDAKLGKRRLADLATWELERDGALVVVDHSFDEGPEAARQAALRGVGFGACGP